MNCDNKRGCVPFYFFEKEWMLLETLVVNYTAREKRYALLKNNRLDKLVVVQPSQESLVGNICLGIVTKVLPGMNAAFVDIGLEKNGYLHGSQLWPSFPSEGKKTAISSLVHQGERLLVQIEKDGTRNKGPRLTGNIEFNGKSIVYMPKGCYIAVSKKLSDPKTRAKWRAFAQKVKSEEEGILFRTACEDFSEEQVLKELEFLRDEYRKAEQASKEMKKPGVLVERNSFLEELRGEMQKMKAGIVACDHLEVRDFLQRANNNKQIEVVTHRDKENIFSAYNLDHELEKALKKMVWLDNGAYLVFDETEALTVIDVNTGKFSGKMEQRDTVVKTNEIAAEEIARQIKLRDIGGIILIDFIDMKEKEDLERIIRKMEAALSYDEKRTRIAGFTSLGILQLTRKRTRVSLSENLTTPCPVCHGTGRVLSAETISFQLERELWEYKNTEDEAVLIDTTTEVKDVFCGHEDIHRHRLEEILGFKILFSITDECRPYYKIRQFGSTKEIQHKVSEK